MTGTQRGRRRLGLPTVMDERAAKAARARKQLRRHQEARRRREEVANQAERLAPAPAGTASGPPGVAGAPAPSAPTPRDEPPRQAPVPEGQAATNQSSKPPRATHPTDPHGQPIFATAATDAYHAITHQAAGLFSFARDHAMDLFQRDATGSVPEAASASGAKTQDTAAPRADAPAPAAPATDAAPVPSAADLFGHVTERVPAWQAQVPWEAPATSDAPSDSSGNVPSDAPQDAAPAAADLFGASAPPALPTVPEGRETTGPELCSPAPVRPTQAKPLASSLMADDLGEPTTAELFGAQETEEHGRPAQGADGREPSEYGLEGYYGWHEHVGHYPAGQEYYPEGEYPERQEYLEGQEYYPEGEYPERQEYLEGQEYYPEGEYPEGQEYLEGQEYPEGEYPEGQEYYPKEHEHAERHEHPDGHEYRYEAEYLQGHGHDTEGHEHHFDGQDTGPEGQGHPEGHAPYSEGQVFHTHDQEHHFEQDAFPKDPSSYPEDQEYLQGQESYSKRHEHLAGPLHPNDQEAQPKADDVPASLGAPFAAQSSQPEPSSVPERGIAPDPDGSRDINALFGSSSDAPFTQQDTDQTVPLGTDKQVCTDTANLFGADRQVGDLFGADKQVESDTANLFGTDQQVESDTANLFGADKQVESNSANLLGTDQQVDSNSANLFGADRQVDSDSATLFGADKQVESDSANLFGADRQVGDLFVTPADGHVDELFGAPLPADAHPPISHTHTPTDAESGTDAGADTTADAPRESRNAGALLGTVPSEAFTLDDGNVFDSLDAPAGAAERDAPTSAAPHARESDALFVPPASTDKTYALDEDPFSSSDALAPTADVNAPPASRDVDGLFDSASGAAGTEQHDTKQASAEGRLPSVHIAPAHVLMDSGTYESLDLSADGVREAERPAAPAESAAAPRPHTPAPEPPATSSALPTAPQPPAGDFAPATDDADRSVHDHGERVAFEAELNEVHATAAALETELAAVRAELASAAEARDALRRESEQLQRDLSTRVAEARAAPSNAVLEAARDESAMLRAELERERKEHAAATDALRREHAAAMDSLRKEYAASADALRKEHATAIDTLCRDYDARLRQVEGRLDARPNERRVSAPRMHRRSATAAAAPPRLAPLAEKETGMFSAPRRPTETPRMRRQEPLPPSQQHQRRTSLQMLRARMDEAGAPPAPPLPTSTLSIRRDEDVAMSAVESRDHARAQPSQFSQDALLFCPSCRNDLIIV